MAADLHAHQVTALAITPGFLRSEAVLDTLGVTEENLRDGNSSAARQHCDRRRSCYTRAMRTLGILLSLALTLSPLQAETKTVWVEDSFQDFADGRLDASGQNLYVSRDGSIRTIHRFDFNQDGFLDLVFNSTHDTAGYLPGTLVSANSDGSLRESSLAVEGSTGIAAADLNRDGHPDLVFCPNHGGIQNPRRLLTIIWGTEDGWPASRSNGILPVYGAQAVAIADLNRDDWPDIVTLNREAWLPGQPEGNIVRIFWGGERGYLLARRLDLGVPDGTDLVAGDLDGDGGRDVAVLAKGSVQLFWSGAGGKTEAPESTRITLPGTSGISLAADDVNGDTLADLLVGTSGDELYLAEGGPGRRFQTAVSVPAYPATHVASGRLDGDDWPDLVLVDLALSRAGGGEIAGAGRDLNVVRVLWGGPSGFSREARLDLQAPFASASAIGDLNSDGHADLALARYQGDDSFTTDSWIYWGKGGRTLERSGRGAETIGATDVVVIPARDSVPAHAAFANSRKGIVDEKVPLQVYWGGPQGFDAGSVWEIPFQSGYESSGADLNADDYADLVVLNSGHGGAAALSSPILGANILWGGADGFDLERRTTLREIDLGSSNVADLDRDGYLDLVLGAFEDRDPETSEELVIHYGTKRGFDGSRRVAVPSPGRSTGCAVADFNRDEWLDIAVTSSLADRIRIFWGGPDGFEAKRQGSLDMPTPISIETADLNRDGYQDLLVGSYYDKPSGHHDTGSLIFWGSRAGFRHWNSQWLPGFTPIGLAVADWDGDGYLDVFSPHYHAELTRESLPCYLYWGGPEGLETRNRTILICDSAHDALAGDFDRDGRLDVAVACHTKDGDHHTVSRVYYNDGNRFADPRVQFLPTTGTHWMGDQDMGHIAHRRWEQTYESSVFRWEETAGGATLEYAADAPEGTRLSFELRSAETPRALQGLAWKPFEGTASVENIHRCLQYRATFKSDNGDRYPVLKRVTISLE